MGMDRRERQTGLVVANRAPYALNFFQSPPTCHIFAVRETFLWENTDRSTGHHDENQRRNRAT
jgi:hypothetical protein